MYKVTYSIEGVVTVLDFESFYYVERCIQNMHCLIFSHSNSFIKIERV